MKSVSVTGGKLTGVLSGDAIAFRNVPYAADPVGSLRFAPPAPHPGWSGTRMASEPGPASPQGPSRLEPVMGIAPALQGENGLLNLCVYRPAKPGPHPVLFWLHGGGFSSGSGGWPWYDASRFAADHDVVVVTPNYRLGALGFMYLPWLSDDLGSGNFGILDQVAAFDWTRSNIENFGGDPNRIVVGGQSAGALSSEALAANPTTRDHIRGVILQSPPASTLIHSPEQAEERARMLLDLLEIPVEEASTRLRELPAEVIVDAFMRLSRATASFGAIAPAMVPVEESSLGLVNRLGGALATAEADAPVLAGITRDEAAAFVLQPTSIGGVTDERIDQWLTDSFGAEREQALARYRDRGAISNLDIFIAAMGHREFASEIDVLVECRLADGRSTWVYEFDWSPTDGGFRSCHCIDLAFLFGTEEAFSEAPMLAGQPVSAALKREFQSAIATFVHTGRPVISEGDWSKSGPDRFVYTFRERGVEHSP